MYLVRGNVGCMRPESTKSCDAFMFKDFQTHTALERADQLVPMCGINSITPPKNGLDVLSGYESYSSCVFGLKVLQRKSSWSILNTKVALFLILSLIVDA